MMKVHVMEIHTQKTFNAEPPPAAEFRIHKVAACSPIINYRRSHRHAREYHAFASIYKTSSSLLHVGHTAYQPD
jgi:hypothetical protein